jgi:L-alanine-DL-glutamate epimerase-like enolase superfamily enzyme
VYNVPVWKLIGPKIRDTFRLYADTPVITPTSALQQRIQTRLNLGFTWFKGDFGLGLLTRGTSSTNGDYYTSPETMPAGFGTAYRVNPSGLTKWANYVASYRAAIGSYPLCSDHYGAIDVTTCINVANAMKTYQMAWMEDMVPWYYPDLLTQINAATDTPILTGEDMFLRDEFQSLINAKAVDIIQPDQATSGGIHETRILSEWAWANGIPTVLHFAGTPISFAANLHIAAGLHGFLCLEHHWIDEMTWWETLGDGLVKPVIQNGYVVLPTGPGLGVVPNQAACTAALSSGGYFTQ